MVTRAPVTLTRTFDDRREQLDREGPVTLETGKRIDERFFEDLDRHPFAAVADDIRCPVAIVHGADDASVSIDDSFEAAGLLQTDVLLEKVAGEGHRFSRPAEERLRTRLFDVLARLDW